MLLVVRDTVDGETLTIKLVYPNSNAHLILDPAMVKLSDNKTTLFDARKFLDDVIIVLYCNVVVQCCDVILRETCKVEVGFDPIELESGPDITVATGDIFFEKVGDHPPQLSVWRCTFTQRRRFIVVGRNPVVSITSGNDGRHDGHNRCEVKRNENVS